MKNKYLKLMLVLLIIFPSLLGCSEAKQLRKAGDGLLDIWRKIRGVPTQVIVPPSKVPNPKDVSEIKKVVKELSSTASTNLLEEAISNGNKISKQKVDKEIERQMKEIKRQMKKIKRNLGTQEEQIEEELEKEVEKDLEENGITITAY
ncbi:MAG: hypothetical protein F6K23_07645 [Okeania sp. SIO2C9]|uniref:hypothetical protein n=1 Tax=Okeania sp. SIO2C9 TaxID=2607791 RepID=UPI0013C0ABCE|nr:hypothetical protein [Okeania sp. SIO2C9]NEQ72954.1 hypothetical protein [Okeania sp. SIO2C9]